MPTIKFKFTSQGGSQISKEIKAIADQLAKINGTRFDGNGSGLGAIRDQAGAAATQVRDLEQASRDAAEGTALLQQAAQIGAQAISAGVREFASFDDAIRAAGVTSQATAEDLEVLREESLRLATVSSKTPEEVAKTSIELSRAGFTALETAEALEGVVRASEATGTSLSKVGDIVAKTIRQFGLSAEDSTRVADVLVQAANSANVSIESLGQSLKFAGVAGAAANQDLETVVTALAALGDVGLGRYWRAESDGSIPSLSAN